MKIIRSRGNLIDWLDGVYDWSGYPVEVKHDVGRLIRDNAPLFGQDWEEYLETVDIDNLIARVKLGYS